MRSGLVNVFIDHRVGEGQRIDKLSVLLFPPLQIFRVLLQSLPPVVLPLLLVDRLLHRAHRLLHRRRHASLLARRTSRKRRGIPLLETVLLLRFELQLRRLPLHHLPLLQLEPLSLLGGHLLLLLDLLHLLRCEHLLLVVHLLLRVELLLLLRRLLGVALLLGRLLEGKRLVGQQVVDHRRRRLLACDWLKSC